MNKTNLIALLIIGIFLSSTALCQDSNFQIEYKGNFEYNSQQILSLADAIPDDTFNWRPDDGVRSLGEAILHMAGANYFFGMTLGSAPPENLNPMEFEKTIKGKEAIMEVLKTSLDYISSAGAAVSDADLDMMVEFPDGQQFTKRAVMIIAISHCSEHKGQLIAYARTNKIAPPWSKQE